MSYSDRLQTIKECGLVDVILNYFNGSEVNIKTVVEDIEWLIKRAEKAEQLQKENWELNKEIGGYSRLILNIAGDTEKITKQIEKLAAKMLECE